MTPLEKLIGIVNGRFIKKDGLIYDRVKDCYTDRNSLMGSDNERYQVLPREIINPYSRVVERKGLKPIVEKKGQNDTN